MGFNQIKLAGRLTVLISLRVPLDSTFKNLKPSSGGRSSWLFRPTSSRQIVRWKRVR